jgi:phage terminase large subunit
MPNHVHVLIDPAEPISKTIQGWKSFSSRWLLAHNERLGLGIPDPNLVWMREYWDRFIRDGDLFIDHESYGYGIELSNTAALFRSVPDSDRYRIEADCSRPETIAFLREPQNGHFDIHGAKKWPGSVEDGIEFMRSFRRIVIHPRCKNTIYEFGAYSFKVDKLTGNVLPIVAPGNDHCVDSIRYALVRLITRRTSIYDSGVL